VFPDVHALNNYLYNIPRAKLVVATGTQTFTTGVQTTVTGMTVELIGGLIAVATDGVIIKVAGDYDIAAWHSWATNATGRRVIRVQVNGADLSPIETNDLTAVSGANSGPAIPTLLRLKVGDKVSTTGLQTSGGDLILNNAVLAVSLKALTK
jgi:hypothetical protein